MGLLRFCCIVNVGLFFFVNPNATQHDPREKTNNSSNQCTLRTYYEPGTVLTAENIKMNVARFLFSNLLNFKCFVCTCGLYIYMS